MHANLCKCECPAEELVLKIERYAQWLTQEYSKYRAFSHDFTAAMLVFQNKGMAAMMMYQTNHPGIETLILCKCFPLFQ